jgi:hypothetical protein
MEIEYNYKYNTINNYKYNTINNYKYNTINNNYKYYE